MYLLFHAIRKDSRSQFNRKIDLPLRVRNSLVKEVYKGIRVAYHPLNGTKLIRIS